jgi:hypothetical protein
MQDLRLSNLAICGYWPQRPFPAIVKPPPIRAAEAFLMNKSRAAIRSVDRGPGPAGGVGPGEISQVAPGGPGEARGASRRQMNICLAMVTKYTKRANQKRRAIAAIEKWEQADAEEKVPTFGTKRA